MRKNIHKSRLNKKLFKGYHEHNDIMVLTEIQNRHILMNNILGNGVLNANIATVAGIIAGIPITFLGSLHWVFKDKIPKN